VSYTGSWEPLVYFYVHTGKWQNNQQFDGGHSAVEVEEVLVDISCLEL
jgi:hypothetical protein